MKVLFTVLFAFSTAYASETCKAQVGTWKMDPGRSDWSNKPGGPPSGVILTITDNGWTMVTERSGKKTELHFDRQTTSVTGDDRISIREEPTGNPCFADMRVNIKGTDKELERVVTVSVPGGKSLLIYGSGIAADGKQWWDSSYFKRVR